MLISMLLSSGKCTAVSTTIWPAGIWLVETAHVTAVEHRGGADDLVHGHHPGAADAHHVQREAVGRHLERRLGQIGLERGEATLPLGRGAHTLDRQERRAVAEQ